MKKSVIISGLLGALVAFVWLTISNAILPVKSSIIHRVAPNQLEIHSVLKANITAPGCYAIPYLSYEEMQANPGYLDEPVYTVTYSGFTHGSAGGVAEFLIPLVVILVVALLASWMLSVTSARAISSYGRRVLFVTLLGIIIALHDDILQMFFGPQFRSYLIFLAVNNVVSFFLMGLVIARKTKPVAG